MLGATLCYMDTQTRLDIRAIAQRLVDRRTTLRLEQTEVAERAGLSRAYVSRLESGTVLNPKLFDLARVAGVLDLPLSSLVSPATAASREIRISECADVLSELDGEPPEIVEDVLLMLRTSVALAKGRRLARDN